MSYLYIFFNNYLHSKSRFRIFIYELPELLNNVIAPAMTGFGCILNDGQFGIFTLSA